jgi:hypothetical protein
MYTGRAVRLVRAQAFEGVPLPAAPVVEVACAAFLAIRNPRSCSGDPSKEHLLGVD